MYSRSIETTKKIISRPRTKIANASTLHHRTKLPQHRSVGSKHFYLHVDQVRFIAETGEICNDCALKATKCVINHRLLRLGTRQPCKDIISYHRSKFLHLSVAGTINSC